MEKITKILCDNVDELIDEAIDCLKLTMNNDEPSFKFAQIKLRDIISKLKILKNGIKYGTIE